MNKTRLVLAVGYLVAEDRLRIQLLEGRPEPMKKALEALRQFYSEQPYEPPSKREPRKDAVS